MNHSRSAAVSASAPEIPHRGLGSLTPRELQVLALIGHGADNGEIAQALNLSKRTVETHIRHLYSKLSLGRRSHLVLFAVECGVTERTLHLSL